MVIDGKITSNDSLLVLRYSKGSIKLSGRRLAAADVNGDGKVDNTDANLILQKSVGRISRFLIER